jgi:hypothetical protein
VLPRTGASSRLAFDLEVPTGTDRLQARIIVSHRNRVL